MPKKIFLFILIIFFSSELYSLEIQFKPEIKQFNLVSELILDIPVNQNDENLKESIAFNIDARTLTGNLFLINNKDNFDCTINAVYAPSFEKFNLGPSVYFHLENFYNVYLDLDYLFGFYFSSQFTELFYFETAIYYMCLTSNIFEIQKYKPWFSTQSLAFKLNFNFKLNNALDCGFEICSFNEYEFNTFVSPFYNFYGNYRINSSLSAGLSVQFFYIDMFTLTAYLESVVIKTSVKWSF